VSGRYRDHRTLLATTPPPAQHLGYDYGQGPALHLTGGEPNGVMKP
jgi:hypothetical protein